VALLEFFVEPESVPEFLWRGKSSGSCVGRPKRCRRSTIAFTSAVTKPAFFTEIAHAPMIPRLTASPCRICS